MVCKLWYREIINESGDELHLNLKMQWEKNIIEYRWCVVVYSVNSNLIFQREYTCIRKDVDLSIFTEKKSSRARG